MRKKVNNQTYEELLTNYGYDNTNYHQLQLEAGHIPLKVCLKLAFKNIWRKKFGYLIMLIVCAISLSFLSFTVELNGDILRQNVFTMIENGYQYTEIKQFVPLDGNHHSDGYSKYNYGDLEENSYRTIKEEIPELVLHCYENVEIKYAKHSIENKNFFYTGIIDTIILFDETNEYNLICGRKPKLHTQEILITDYLIAAYQYFDLIPTLPNYTDYLGMYINLNWYNGYKVVGIIDTNYEKWTKFSRLSEIDETNKNNYSFLNDFKMMNAVVLNEEYFEIEKSAIGDYTSIKDADINITFSRSSKVCSKDTDSLNIIGTSIGTSIPLLSIRNLSSDSMKPRYPNNDNEIVVPIEILEDFFNFKLSYMTNRLFKDYWVNEIFGKQITLSFTSSDKLRTYTKEYTIVGVTDSTTGYIISDNEITKIKNLFFTNLENIMVELPSDPNHALSLFNKALNCRDEEKGIPGYVINVWVYRSDIDSYEVNPFIDLISKGGLFVFTIFTIGIMWTIISIEIVDSKKEIGILRSIGLSGTKVSLIFIIQTLFVNLIAYGIAVAVSSQIIPLYNSTITDNLGIITIYMYTFTYRTPVYLLIFVVAITLFSTIIPLLKIMSQKIIDVINEREK